MARDKSALIDLLGKVGFEPKVATELVADLPIEPDLNAYPTGIQRATGSPRLGDAADCRHHPRAWRPRQRGRSLVWTGKAALLWGGFDGTNVLGEGVRITSASDTHGDIHDKSFDEMVGVLLGYYREPGTRLDLEGAFMLAGLDSIATGNLG